jgi:hypothetical protein
MKDICYIGTTNMKAISFDISTCCDITLGRYFIGSDALIKVSPGMASAGECSSVANAGDSASYGF